uniref:Cell division cycle 25C n=1 Tax=Jaculus jaculus TaxID=51337 RepID=A0A8C5NVS9_JACJA
MSTEIFPAAREEESCVSGPSFRSNQRKMLQLLLERDSSFTNCPARLRSPRDKLLDSANLSILSGGTPKRCLDLSNLSSGEMSATQFTTSADLDETGSLDSSGHHEVHLVVNSHPQDLMKGISAQFVSSTPNSLDRGHGVKDAISANKQNENTTLKASDWQTSRILRLQRKPGKPLVSPLSLLEMKYLGSPITAIPRSDRNPKLEDQEEEISDELMDFFLEDQEDIKDFSLQKTDPLSDVDITQILEENSDQGHLIGDFSKVCALPTVPGRHQDLKYINPETGALNMPSRKELHDFFLKKPFIPLDIQKRIIIVFHCEFSSERGPRMCRSLREEDRALNQYPALHYPELYILKGGYRDFFTEYMDLCEPRSYCPMHHQDHQAELLQWRSQSKAQEGERQLQEQIALLTQDRSTR